MLLILELMRQKLLVGSDLCTGSSKIIWCLYFSNDGTMAH